MVRLLEWFADAHVPPRTVIGLAQQKCVAQQRAVSSSLACPTVFLEREKGAPTLNVAASRDSHKSPFEHQNFSSRVCPPLVARSCLQDRGGGGGVAKKKGEKGRRRKRVESEERKKKRDEKV